MRGGGPHRSVDAGGLRGAGGSGSFPPREATVWVTLPWDVPYPGASPTPWKPPSRAESPQNGVSVEGKGGGQRHRLWTVS